MQRIIDQVKKMVTAKAIISAASLGLFIPFARLVYWVFDTSYLGGFGVSPDVYSRPIFSSGFVSIWLLVESMTPIFFGWSSFAIVLFVVLFSVNFDVLKKYENRHNYYGILSSDSKGDELKKRFSYAFSKSSGWPFYIWVSGVSLFLFLVLAISLASSRGRDLAQKQLNYYVDTGKCADKFNSTNVGCFRVEGVEGAGHFVIANPKTHLLYLSRQSADQDLSEFCESKCEITLHILEKEPGKQYSIDRVYMPVATDAAQVGGTDEPHEN